MGYDWISIALIVFLVFTAVAAGLYYLNRWAIRKNSQQTEMVEKYKQNMTIYVISKTKDKASNVNLQKQVYDQLPKFYKFLKMHFVKAKVGPQIITFMCDKNVYNAIPIKKNVKIQAAGIYIVSVEGMKSAKEYKQMKKEKKKKS